MKHTAVVLILVSSLVGCGVKGSMDAVQAMPGKMDDTTAQMNRTNDTVEQQPVAIALEKMLDPQYGVALEPIPFDIMPFAETFGKYATTEQIVKIVYLWMQKLNVRTIGIGDPTDEQKAAFNHQQKQTYFALISVCGLLPDAKVQKIVQEQIVSAGRFEITAKQLLMLRVRFIRDILITASLLSEQTESGAPINNIGKVEFGVTYANSIEYVARLPFAAELSFDIFGFLPPEEEIKETMNPAKVAVDAWTNIRGVAAGIPASISSVTGNPAQDKAIYAQEVARKNKALAIIDAKLKGWGAKP